MNDVEDRMKKAVEAVEKEFKTVRTGRAHPSILDRVNVDYYGAKTPLKNLANISNIDGKTLSVTPFDKSLTKEIEKSIIDSQLGLTPGNDGQRLLIVIPELTKQRREELAKQVKKESEAGKVSIRNIRRDALDKIKKQEEDLSEDERRRHQDEIQKLTDKYIALIDDVTNAKEKEIISI